MTNLYPRRWWLMAALAVGCLACEPDTTADEPGGESPIYPIAGADAAVAEDGAIATSDTGTSPTPEPVTFMAPPTGCDAPSSLPTDPLSLTGTANPTSGGGGGGGGGFGGGGGGGQKHLVNITYSASEDRIYATGIPALAVLTPTGSNPTLEGTKSGNFQHIADLGGGLVALTTRGGTAGNTAKNPNAAMKSGKLVILDASNPSNISQLSNTQVDDASGIAFDGSYLYLMTHLGEFRTLDVSNPASPEVVGSVSGLGNPWEMTLVGTRAYVADNTLGLVVVDLSNPQSPAIVSSVNTAGGAQDIDADGDVVWVAVGGAGVEAFTLADPANPSSLGTTDIGGAAISVSASEGLVWASNQESVVVLDGSDPLQPVPLGVEDTPSWAMHVYADGDTAYLADWNTVGVYQIDTMTPAPDADAQQSQLYFTGGDQVVTMDLTNRGGHTLEIAGMDLPDPRFAVEVSGLSAEPGETLSVRLTFTDDGQDVDTALCIATNDPDEPVQEITVASTSAGGTSVLIGEPAPDFNLPSTEGGSYILSSQLGSPVVLCFFSTW